MAYELKEGQGSVFPNDRKESDSHADWRGSIKIDGKEYWLNGWNKQGKSDWISFSVKLKDPNKTVATALKKVREQSNSKSDRGSGFEDDDSIPF